MIKSIVPVERSFVTLILVHVQCKQNVLLAPSHITAEVQVRVNWKFRSTSSGRVSLLNVFCGSLNSIFAPVYLSSCSFQTFTFFLDPHPVITPCCVGHIKELLGSSS